MKRLKQYMDDVPRDVMTSRVYAQVAWIWADILEHAKRQAERQGELIATVEGDERIRASEVHYALLEAQRQKLQAYRIFMEDMDKYNKNFSRERFEEMVTACRKKS